MAIFGKSDKETLNAAFDITSSSVGGILFSHHPKKLPEILTSSRFQTDFLPDLELQKFERALQQAFERTLNHLKKSLPQGKKRPDSAIITLFSPYYVSQSKVVRFAKENPFEVTKGLIEDIVTGETEAFKKRWWTGRAAPKENYGVELIEDEKMQTTLNGYKIAHPIGKYAKSGEIYLYTSLGVKSIQEKLKEYIEHIFGGVSVRFQSFPFMAFNALKRIMSLDNGLLLIDIGGEITEIVLIRDGILEETISFPLGENALVRRISSVFRFSPEESFSLLVQYSRGDLHDATREKTRKIIEEAAVKWCQLLKDSMKKTSGFQFLPQNFLFIGGRAASVMKEFTHCVIKDSVRCVKMEETTFSTGFLLAEALKKHFNFKRGFDEDKDILLMLEVLFADKLMRTD